VSADQRVELAREYLAAARQRDIGHMPPSRLMAELAETRRQLGLVLAAAAGLEDTIVFPEGPRHTMLGALDDAATYREQRAAAWCDRCESAPEGACPEHLDDLDAVDAYRDLARQLGGQR
jgi:hypothetical protein